MEAAPAASWLLEVLVTLVTVGLPGLPPGERDPNLWHAVPADAVVAFEWSARGPGAPGAIGIEGLVADSEVRQALQRLEVLLSPPRGEDGAPNTVYDVSASNVAHVLLSRPGCLYVGLAPKESGIPPLQRLRAAVVLHAGPHSDAILHQLQPLLPGWLLRDTNANPADAAKVTGLAQFRRVGPYLVWGINLGAADEALTRLTAQQGGLASVPEFIQRSSAASVERPGSVLWFNAPAVMEAVFDFVPRAAELKAQLPVAMPGRFVLVTGLEQGRVVIRGSCNRNATPVDTLKPDLLQFVPADAHVVLAGGFDLDLVGPLLKSGAAGVTADGRAALSQLRQALMAATDHDFDAEVLSAFGTHWTVYSAPSTGGPFGLGPVFTWDLTQPLLLQDHVPNVMTRWREQLANDATSGWSLQQEEFLDHVIYTLHSPDSPRLGTVPSWCVTDRHLILAAQPQPLRSHLRFLSSQQPRFAARIGRDVSFPNHATTWGYVDSPTLTQTVWPLLPFALARQEQWLPIEEIPSSGAILPHLGPTTFFTQAHGDSWQFECRNPLSLAAPVLAGVAIYEAVKAPSPTQIEESSPTLGVELGAPAGGETTASPANGRVTPAVATEDRPAPSAARRLAPSLIRAFTPEDIQSLIPPEVFRRLEEGPTPEQQLRKKERQEKRALRKGIAP
jgi:hypothetical protein